MSLHRDSKYADQNRKKLLEELEPAIAKYCADYGIPRSAVTVDVAITVLRELPEVTRERSMIAQPLQYQGIV
jgi:hypothetical protein